MAEVKISQAIDGEDQQTEWAYFNASPLFALYGTFSATIHVQYSHDRGGTVIGEESFTSPDSKLVNLPSNGLYLRAHCKTGNYSSGTANVLFVE